MKGKTMDTQELIARSESQIDDFKKKSEIILKDNINQEIIKTRILFLKIFGMKNWL